MLRSPAGCAAVPARQVAGGADSALQWTPTPPWMIFGTRFEALSPKWGIPVYFEERSSSSMLGTMFEKFRQRGPGGSSPSPGSPQVWSQLVAVKLYGEGQNELRFQGAGGALQPCFGFVRHLGESSILFDLFSRFVTQY